MHDQKRRCEERKELERLIWRCVDALSYYSIAASQLVRDRAMPADLALVRSEYRAASSRLRVLRECLGLHMKCHQCSDPAIRSEMLAVYPHLEGSKDRIPAQEPARETGRATSSRSEGQAA